MSLCTAADRELQRGVGRMVARAWGGEYYDVDDEFARIDGFIHRRVAGSRWPLVTHFLEVKVRPRVWDYDKVFVSYRKYCDLLVAQRDDVPAYFVIADRNRLSDVRAWRVRRGEYPLVFAGRRDRPGVHNDQEPLLLVPRAEFVKLEET